MLPLALKFATRYGRNNARQYNKRSNHSATIVNFFDKAKFKEMAAVGRAQVLASLSSSLKPTDYDDFLRELHLFFSKNVHGIDISMLLRTDVLKAIKAGDKLDKEKYDINLLNALDRSLHHYLSIFFSVSALALRRITFENSSGVVLEKIASGELVHRFKHIADLKHRLKNGKRCYALFHNSFPEQPLAFIHIALTNTLESSLRSIYATDTELPHPTHATFYSVSSPYRSLSGLDLASYLIKVAVMELKEKHPSIQTFSTLSPIPDFMKWCGRTLKEGALKFTIPDRCKKPLVNLRADIETKTDLEIMKFIYFIVHPTNNDSLWITDKNVVESISEIVMFLVARYLCCEKISGQHPVDPVARFHCRNGAQVHRLNWLANPNASGLVSSAGLMVNYLYDLDKMEERKESFAFKCDLSINEGVTKLLD